MPRRPDPHCTTNPDSRERYGISWPGRGAAESDLASPSRYVPDQPLDTGGAHLFVEGDSLDALKLLLPVFEDKVKVCYIDPPYNTRRSFVYSDRCSAASRNGAQSDSSFHAAWLSMMYPRLVIARRMLRSDGACFVSIDDHELHTLRMIMDEIFGTACFRNCIIFGRGPKSVQAQFPTVGSLGIGHEYVVMYARDPAARFAKLELPRDMEKAGTWNNHWRGTDRPTMRYPLFGIRPERGQWRWSQERSRDAVTSYERMLREVGADASSITQAQIDAWYLRECALKGRRPALLRLSARGKPEHYVPPAASRVASDVWLDLPTRGSGEIRALFGSTVFDNPKPIGLIRRILSFTTSARNGDIVLDFFAGSCSTAAAVMEQNSDDGGNRQFIMVQSPEPVDSSRETGRNALAAGLPTIAAIGRERIRRAAAKIGGRGVGGAPAIRYIVLAEKERDPCGAG